MEPFGKQVTALSTFDLSVLGWSAEWHSHLERGLEPARVVAVHRGALDLYTAAGVVRTRLPGRLTFAATDIAVGDWVGLGDATVQSVLPRRTALVRNAAGRATRRQTLVANIDLALLVCSLGLELDPQWIERGLVAIWESGAVPEIVLTKADRIGDPRPFVERAEALAPGVPVHVVSALSGAGCERLRARIERGATAVLLGSSGVGKSTLVNYLAGSELMATSETRGDDQGRHTTSHRQLILLPGGGVVIDMPGLRELALWETAGSLDQMAFTDIDEVTGGCRFADCTHTSEPGCAVVAAVHSGALRPERVQSWHELRRELQATAIRRDQRVRMQETRARRLRRRRAVP
jgi:ribosome biogenesis GTPase / thiamine phosphate phosphatase